MDIKISLSYLTEKWNTDDCPLIDLFKVAVLISELVAYEPATQIAGVQIIIDLQGFGWSHVVQFTKNLNVVQTMVHHFEVRVKGFWCLLIVNIFSPYKSHFRLFWKIKSLL